VDRAVLPDSERGEVKDERFRLAISVLQARHPLSRRTPTASFDLARIEGGDEVGQRTVGLARTRLRVEANAVGGVERNGR